MAGPVLRVTGDRPQIYQIFVANLLTWKTASDGPVDDPLMSENFTDCRKWEKEHSGFNLLKAWHDVCSSA
jgi:hypothetical protein